MRWFKHDSNAILDSKLKKVRLKYGMEGYGLYWYCLECIARNVEKHNLTFELEEDSELIAADTNIHYERVQEMMRFMVDIGLFQDSEGRIFCLKMAERTDDYTQKLLRSASNAPDIIRIVSGQTPDSVGIKSGLIEENRIKQKRSTRFKPPTVEEVAEYCRSRKNGIDAEEFIDHYEANGWMRGKQRVKSWQACVRTWEKKRKSNGATGEFAL